MPPNCEKLNNVLKKIESFRLSSGRPQIQPTTSIKLVAVSKTRSPAEITELYNCGQRIFGENRVQELTEKIPVLPKDIIWHFIGRLQKNKVNKLVGMVDLIQSVDDLDLLRQINNRAQIFGICQDVLLQVNVPNDPAKAGFPGGSLFSALDEALKMENVSIAGLMTIGPLTENTDEIREVFRSTRAIFDKISWDHLTTSAIEPILSMGMTDDLLIAIEEGATMVRIGRALF